MAVLEAKNVTKRFGGLQALSNIDLQIKEKSIHSVIGPNGAGKTTFFNCVTGFYIPEEGEVVFKRSEYHRPFTRPGYPPWDFPDLPEHPPLQEHDRRGEHPCRHASAPEIWPDRRHPAGQAHDQGGG